MKFFLRLSNLDSERYANKAFNILVADNDAGHSNWVTTARNLLTLYNVSMVDNKIAIKRKVHQHFQSLISNNLKTHLVEAKKLRTYALFKTTFKFESYLDILSDFSLRSNFAKLRLSAHNLQIESGRYGIKNTPAAERYCLYCKINDDYVVEDEVHFLVNCPLYREDREKMLEAIYSRFPSTKLLNEQSLFIWLLSQEDFDSLVIVATFCN